MEYRSYLAATRSDNLLLSVLKPEQSIAYLSWLQGLKKKGKYDSLKKLLERAQKRNSDGEKMETVQSGATNVTSEIPVSVCSSFFEKGNAMLKETTSMNGSDNGDELDQLCQTLNDNLKVDF